MRAILVIVLFGLASQNSLALPSTILEPPLMYDNIDSALDPVLTKLEALENREAEQTIMVSTLQSSYDNILEKLTRIEQQITGLQKDAQLAVDMREWLEPTEGPVIEKRKERLVENYERIGSKYYHIESNEQLDWHEALAKCKSLNGSLLSLKSEAEWKAITARLDKTLSYWVDINDRETEGEFMSETSGKAAPFLKWDIHEPNNIAFTINNENCVELRSQYNHYMNDINCFNKNHYICEENVTVVFI